MILTEGCDVQQKITLVEKIRTAEISLGSVEAITIAVDEHINRAMDNF